jgi:hypothetical protein
MRTLWRLVAVVLDWLDGLEREATDMNKNGKGLA